MEELPLERAWRAAQDEIAEWEPPEGWEALADRRERRELSGELWSVVVVVVVTAVLTALTWPRTLVFLITGGFALLGIARRLRRMTPGERRKRREEVLHRLKCEQAVRRHVPVGAHMRAAVTEHAEEILTYARYGTVGWPLLALVGAVLAVAQDRVSVQLVGGLWILLAVIGLARSRRRAAWARRWLDDPLPRRATTS